jgi:hypothetical protein
VLNGILDMTKMDDGDFEIRPESGRRGGVIGGCCELPAPKQILIDLVSNAIKFPNRGGRLTVRAAVGGNRIALAVEDNGIDIREGTCRVSASRSSRRAAATIGATTQPGSAARSSRAWWRCTVGTSQSVAGSAKRRASRPIASRHAPPLHHPNIVQRPPAQVGPAASNTTRRVRKSA